MQKWSNWYGVGLHACHCPDNPFHQWHIQLSQTTCQPLSEHTVHLTETLAKLKIKMAFFRQTNWMRKRDGLQLFVVPVYLYLYLKPGVFHTYHHSNGIAVHWKRAGCTPRLSMTPPSSFHLWHSIKLISINHSNWFKLYSKRKFLSYQIISFPSIRNEIMKF